MRCPFCDHVDTQVIDTRASDDGDSIRRRRRCPHCDKRFTTYERIELSLPAVVNKNGSRTDFDRRKLRASLRRRLRSEPREPCGPMSPCRPTSTPCTVKLSPRFSTLTLAPVSSRRSQ